MEIINGSEPRTIYNRRVRVSSEKKVSEKKCRKKVTEKKCRGQQVSGKKFGEITVGPKICRVKNYRVSRFGFFLYNRGALLPPFVTFYIFQLALNIVDVASLY